MATPLAQLAGQLLAVLIPALCSAQRTTDTSPVPWLLTRMTLDLRVDYDRHSVFGTTALTLHNTSNGAVSHVPLLLNRLMHVDQISNRGGRALHFDQHIAQFRDDSVWQATTIDVTLDHAIRPGDSTTLAIRYGGILVGYAETGSLYIRDRVSRDFTILREDAFAFPRLGVASWAAQRTIQRDPFTFDVRVTVPTSLVVATAGELVDTTRTNSSISWHYRSADAVPFLNITIAPYDVFTSGDTKVFSLPADSSGARTLQRATTVALERMTAMFGPVDRRRPLVVIEIPEGFGSQASLTGGIIQTADAFRNPRELRQVYHELSHLWNPPDLDQPSPRWNEGFASFMQWRLAEELGASTERAAQIERATQSAIARCTAMCATTPLVDYGARGLTDLSYPVGMLLFEALYEVLGHDRFDATYGELFRTHRDPGLRTTDLIAAFTAADARARPIFAAWATSTRWLTRLRNGESFGQIVASYR